METTSKVTSLLRSGTQILLLGIHLIEHIKSHCSNPFTFEARGTDIGILCCEFRARVSKFIAESEKMRLGNKAIAKSVKMGVKVVPMIMNIEYWMNP